MDRTFKDFSGLIIDFISYLDIHMDRTFKDYLRLIIGIIRYLDTWIGP